jgi:tryptophan synthase beta subunit
MSLIEQDRLKFATLEISGIVFEGVGALERKYYADNVHGLIIFSFNQLGITTQEEARSKVSAGRRGVFTGIRYVSIQNHENTRIEAEDIKAEVNVIETGPNGNEFIVRLEFLRRIDEEI